MTIFLLAAMLLSATPEPSAALDGAWETACLPIGENGRHGVVTRLRVDGDRMEVIAQVYATRTCQAPTFQVRYDGRIEGRSNGKVSLSFQHRVEAIDLTPQDQAVVDQYNSTDGGRHGCGLSGWRLNIAQSVAGQECAPFRFARTGSLLYDSAWIDGDGTLSFGALPMIWSNSTAEKRPGKPLPITYHRVGR